MKKWLFPILLISVLSIFGCTPDEEITTDDILSYCENFPGIQRDRCLRDKAIENLDYTLCGEINDYYCFTEVAIGKSDFSICELIDSPYEYVKDSCYTSYAREKEDESICDEIIDERRRSGCHSYFDYYITNKQPVSILTHQNGSTSTNYNPATVLSNPIIINNKQANFDDSNIIAIHKRYVNHGIYDYFAELENGGSLHLTAGRGVCGTSLVIRDSQYVQNYHESLFNPDIMNLLRSENCNLPNTWYIFDQSGEILTYLDVCDFQTIPGFNDTINYQITTERLVSTQDDNCQSNYDTLSNFIDTLN